MELRIRVQKTVDDLILVMQLDSPTPHDLLSSL